jgi:uncharacterized membrane protein
MMFGLRRRRSSSAALNLTRQDAITDGVYSVALTLLVLDLKIPAGLADPSLAVLLPVMTPKVLSFVLGFVMAGSAWIYVHQISALYVRTNLGHLVRTMASLMFVCALPFTTAAMGDYSDQPLGPMLYSGNVMILVAIYTIDLALSRAALIPDTVDRRLLNQILVVHIGAVLWAGFCCFYLSPRSPHLAIGGVVAYLAMHWISIWWFEPQMHVARSAIEGNNLPSAAG